MSVRQVLRIEGDVVTDRPVTIPFDFDPATIPTGKTAGDSIVITPIKVRTWDRLKPLLISIDKKDREALAVNKDVVFNDALAGIMAKYDDILFEMVCIGIHNKSGDMPAWFREVLRQNCTWEDIYILLNAILFRIGCNPFSRTIIALEAVSPLGEEEMIALQRNHETWTYPDRKVASCS